MTAVSARPPPQLQPRPKAIAITQPAAVSNKLPPSQPPTPAVSRTSSRQLSGVPLSEKSTTALVRRVLCSPLADKAAPISELLPPLTSSNDVDLQLYAFIAIVIKEFVYTWYAKITPDQTFVEEVVRVIAHCTRGIEQRLRKVDLESLVFDELPELLETHIKVYRASHYPLHPPPLEADPRSIYHSLWPHPALSPIPDPNNPASIQQQKENESAYRQLLVEGILAVLLPTEDLENDALRSLVGQIFSEMIIGNGIGGKACESWLLWEGFTKIAEAIQNQLPKAKAQARAEKSAAPVVQTSEATGLAEPVVKRRKSRLISFSVTKTFWLILQYLFLIFTTVRFLITTVVRSSSLPPRTPPFVKIKGETPVKERLQAPLDSRPDSRILQPVLSMKIWSCVSKLLDLDVRMPWLGATLAMLQWTAIRGPGEIGDVDGMIDKILVNHLLSPILSPTRLPRILVLLRSALFPNNAPAPPRIPPSTAQEIEKIKRNAALAILRLVPRRVRSVYFGPPNSSPSASEGVGVNVEGKGDESGEVGKQTGSEEREEGEGEGNERQIPEHQIRQFSQQVLDLFSDAYANKHLMYAVLELVVVRVVPELVDNKVEGLLGERLG